MVKEVQKLALHIASRCQTGVWLHNRAIDHTPPVLTTSRAEEDTPSTFIPPGQTEESEQQGKSAGIEIDSISGPSAQPDAIRSSGAWEKEKEEQEEEE